MKTVLAFDPGTSIIGYAIIAINDDENKITVPKTGIISLSTNNLLKKNKIIYNSIKRILDNYKYGIDIVAIEIPHRFFNARMANIVGAIKTAVAIFLPINTSYQELFVTSVRKKLFDNGRATKAETKKTLSAFFDIEFKLADIVDAVAVGIAALHAEELLSEKIKEKLIAKYLEKNPPSPKPKI